MSFNAETAVEHLADECASRLFGLALLTARQLELELELGNTSVPENWTILQAILAHDAVRGPSDDAVQARLTIERIVELCRCSS